MRPKGGIIAAGKVVEFANKPIAQRCRRFGAKRGLAELEPSFAVAANGA